MNNKESYLVEAPTALDRADLSGIHVAPGTRPIL